MKYFPVIRKCGLLILAGISVWLVCIVFRPSKPLNEEPQYQGKKLTDWAKEIDQADFFRQPAFQLHQEKSEQAIAAIRQIGTNALPVALELCRAKDPWLKWKWEEWTHQYNLPADEKRFEGINIIWALGSMTKPIIPDLVQLLQSRDREIAEDVMYALPGTGTNAVPPLIELLHGSDKDVRIRAAIILGKFFGTQAHAAVPVLLQCIDDQNLNLIMRVQAIHALGFIKQDAPVIVPEMLRHIQSETNRLILMNYFSALGRLGTNAPSMKQLQNPATAQAYALTPMQVSNYARNFQSSPVVVTNASTSTGTFNAPMKQLQRHSSP